MSFRILPVFAFALIAVLLARGDEPKPAEKAKAAEEPLPKGAKVRFGSGRLMFRAGYTLLPPDYKTILTADTTGGYRRFDVATGLTVGATRGGVSPGGGVIGLGDGKRAVATRAIRVWDVAADKELFAIKMVPGGNQITAAAFSPDSSLFAFSFGEGPIELWDVKAGKSKQTLLGRTGMGVRVAFSPDGKTL